MTETPTQTPDDNFTDIEAIQADQASLAEAQPPTEDGFVNEAAERARQQFVDLAKPEPRTTKERTMTALKVGGAAGAAVVAITTGSAGVDSFFSSKDQSDIAHETTLDESEATKQNKFDTTVIGDTPNETAPLLEEQSPASSPVNIPTPKTH